MRQTAFARGTDEATKRRNRRIDLGFCGRPKASETAPIEERQKINNDAQGDMNESLI